jgi:excisionase family DNA binding protein
VPSNTSQYQRYLTPQEVAEVVGTSRKTIYRRIADGSLPAVRLGDGLRAPVRIGADDLDAYLARGRSFDRERSP